MYAKSTLASNECFLWPRVDLSGVYQLGMLKKFQDSVNSVDRQYYQHMKREKPLRIQKRGDWMMSEDEYVNLLLCKWGVSVKHV